MRRDKAGRDKTRQDETRQDKARPCKDGRTGVQVADGRMLLPGVELDAFDKLTVTADAARRYCPVHASHPKRSWEGTGTSRFYFQVHRGWGGSGSSCRNRDNVPHILVAIPYILIAVPCILIAIPYIRIAVPYQLLQVHIKQLPQIGSSVSVGWDVPRTDLNNRPQPGMSSGDDDDGGGDGDDNDYEMRANPLFMIIQCLN